MAAAEDSDDGMDEFMERFKTERYQKAFSENNWEEEFDKIPMFMKKAPEEIDPQKHPELACIQSILHDEDRPPEEQARGLKDEGNAFFKEKDYEKAVLSYTAGLKKKCSDQDLNVVLLTNRAAAQYYLGNVRSALNDAAAAKKIKPDHQKALIRGAQCCIDLRHFPEALQWCDEGLRVHPSDRKLRELRAAADKHRRAAERDARKAKLKEKKVQGEKEALLAAIKDRGIKLFQGAKPPQHDSDGEDEDERSAEDIAQLSLDGFTSKDVTGTQVVLDQLGALHWPVLLLYPEHQQTDFISAFHENSCFVDHLTHMFEELPPWDSDRKYLPENLQLYFEDEEEDTFYQIRPETSLLEVLQHERFFVKAGNPSFMVLVRGSAFWKKFLSGKKTREL